MTVIPDRRYTSALAREIPPPTAAVRKVTGKNGLRRKGGLIPKFGCESLQLQEDGQI